MSNRGWSYCIIYPCFGSKSLQETSSKHSGGDYWTLHVTPRSRYVFLPMNLQNISIIKIFSKKNFQNSHNKPEANCCFSFMYNHISKKDLQMESHERPPARMSDTMRKETHVHFYLPAKKIAANNEIPPNKMNWEPIGASLYRTLLLVRRYNSFMELSV